MLVAIMQQLFVFLYLVFEALTDLRYSSCTLQTVNSRGSCRAGVMDDWIFSSELPICVIFILFSQYLSVHLFSGSIFNYVLQKLSPCLSTTSLA